MMPIYYKDFRYLKTFIERHSGMWVNIDALTTSLQTVKTPWNQTHDHHIQQLFGLVGETDDMIKDDQYDALNQHSIIKLFQREISDLDTQLN